jgi:hypothetical protein
MYCQYTFTIRFAIWRTAEEDYQEGGSSKCPIGLPSFPRQRYDPSGPWKASAPPSRNKIPVWKTYCCVLPKYVEEMDYDRVLPADHSTACPSPRFRAVKTLSFSCAAGRMDQFSDQFADVIDLSQYSMGLWEGISTAVTSLPSIVAKSAGVLHQFSRCCWFSRPVIACGASVENVIMGIGPTIWRKLLHRRALQQL